MTDYTDPNAAHMNQQCGRVKNKGATGFKSIEMSALKKKKKSLRNVSKQGGSWVVL